MLKAEEDGTPPDLQTTPPLTSQNGLPEPEVHISEAENPPSADKSKESYEPKEGCSKMLEQQPLMKKKKTEYIALRLVSPQAKECPIPEKQVEYPEEEDVINAYATFFFTCFNLFWSIGVAYWHIQTECFSEGVITVIVVLMSGVIVQGAYFLNKNSPKTKIWKESKFISILSAIPCLLPILLASANTVFVMKEVRCNTYQRPWFNTRTVFLVESLSLGFPQCVLQLCILMEDDNSIPSSKGLFAIFGIFILTMGITFARVRYDSSEKWDRFGSGVEKYLQYCFIWSSKMLWLLTYCCVLITVRLRCPSYVTLCTVSGVIALLLLFEIPILFSAMKQCGEFVGNCTSLFFLLPQFASLLSLIFWVNTDANIYNTNIGCTVLGGYFWTETILLFGWLIDRCRDRDMDYISTYPHFFGNLFASCCR